MASEEIANRIPCADFAVFRPLFVAIQDDIDRGVRKTLRFAKDASIRVDDVAPNGYTLDRATVRQKKTGRPVQFELTEPATCELSSSYWGIQRSRAPSDISASKSTMQSQSPRKSTSEITGSAWWRCLSKPVTGAAVASARGAGPTNADAIAS